MTSTEMAGPELPASEPGEPGPIAPRPPRPGSRRRRKAQFDWQMLALLTVMVAMAVFVWGSTPKFSTISGLIVGPVLLAIATPLIVLVAKGEKRFDLVGLMLFSFALRLVVSVPRLLGAVDANVYHEVGVQLADSFRSFQFGVDTGREVPGTGSVRYVSGLVHVITADNFFAAFLVFTFLAFWGTWFFYKAFTIALPEADHYRYARLLFLWPSMLFWTSSIGKEACMTVTVGLASLGIALIITKRWIGIVVFLLGSLGTFLIRPHMALVILVALLAALVFPRSTGGSSFSLGVRLVGLVGLLVVGSMLARSTAEFFNLENLSSSNVTSALDATEEQTTQGGSNFTPARVHSPLDYPYAVVTVLVRPFPFEAKSGEARLTSFESMFLLALFLFSLRRLVHLPRLMTRYSYISFTVFYLLIFCFVFAVIGNFGILERQRTQALPFVFVLLALPAVAATSRRRLPEPIARIARRGRTRTDA